MKNLLSASLPENNSREAVADVAYISNLGEIEAPEEKFHLPVTVSSCDKEAGPPLPQSKEMEASCCELLKLMAKWAPLKEREERLVKLPANPSLMPRLAPLPPVESLPQSNFLVDESQLRVSPGASPSPNNPPSLSGRLKAEILAVPDTSKSLVTEAKLEKEGAFEIVIWPESLDMVATLIVPASNTFEPTEASLAMDRLSFTVRMVSSLSSMVLAWRVVKSLMELLAPVTVPPRVKALMVRVEALAPVMEVKYAALASRLVDIEAAPITSSLVVGLVVPMPMLPREAMVNSSVPNSEPEANLTDNLSLAPVPSV